MTVHAELLMGRAERLIYVQSLTRWAPPFEQEEVTEEKRQSILAQICKYLDAHGVQYKIAPAHVEGGSAVNEGNT